MEHRSHIYICIRQESFHSPTPPRDEKRMHHMYVCSKQQAKYERYRLMARNLKGVTDTGTVSTTLLYVGCGGWNTYAKINPQHQKKKSNKLIKKIAIFRSSDIIRM